MPKKFFYFVTIIFILSMLTGCFSISINKPNTTPNTPSNPTNPPVENEKPTVYVLSVGINDYASDNLNDLLGCENDATSFNNKFKEDVYINLVAQTLLSEQATKENIKNAIYSLTNSANEDSIFIFTYSGHGLRHSSETVEYIAPYDTVLTQESLISDQELKAWVNNIKPETCIFIFDACHSAGMIKPSDDPSYNYRSVLYLQSDMSIIAKNLSEISTKNIIAMSASDIHEYSSDMYNFTWAGGLFSTFILEGMSKKGDTMHLLTIPENDYPADGYILSANEHAQGTAAGVKDNIITVSEAFNYAAKKVDEYQKQHANSLGSTQTPYFYCSAPVNTNNITALFHIPAETL